MQYTVRTDDRYQLKSQNQLEKTAVCLRNFCRGDALAKEKTLKTEVNTEDFEVNQCSRQRRVREPQLQCQRKAAADRRS